MILKSLTFTSGSYSVHFILDVFTNHASRDVLENEFVRINSIEFFYHAKNSKKKKKNFNQIEDMTFGTNLL